MRKWAAAGGVVAEVPPEVGSHASAWPGAIFEETLPDMATLDEVTAAVRTEIAKHVFRQFADSEDFTRDLCIASDDLSYISLELEDKFGVTLARDMYREINNVVELARALHTALSTKGSGERM
jgi:hypothetical protein